MKFDISMVLSMERVSDICDSYLIKLKDRNATTYRKQLKEFI